MSIGLLFDKLPIATEEMKTDQARHVGVIGESVNDHALVQTILSHGTFDHYYFIQRGSTAYSPSDHYIHSQRLKAVDIRNVDQLERDSGVILFTSSILFQHYACFRLAMGHREWPICGITHTLSTIYPRASFGSPKLFEYDALICTTPSAKQVLQNLMDEHSASHAVVQPFPALPSIRYPVIPLGVRQESVGDPARKLTSRRAWNLKEGTVVFLFLGRLSRNNKADLFPIVRAFLQDDELPLDCCLIIAGDDTRNHISGDLRDLVASVSSSRVVRIAPDVTADEKRELLSAADVFLAVSDTLEETFGLAVVEAMMSQLPVIASDWDGYKHLLTSGKEGLLVRTYMAHDMQQLSALLPLLSCDYHIQQRVIVDLGQLRNAWRALAGSEHTRLEYGIAARQRAEHEYAWPRLLKRYEALWREQLALAALRKSDPATGPCPYPAVYDNGRVFAHYPAQLLSLETVLFAAPSAEADRSNIRAGSYYLRPDPTFDVSLDDKIIDRVLREGTVTVGRLASLLGYSRHQRLLVESQIWRLVKNGVLLIHDSFAT